MRQQPLIILLPFHPQWINLNFWLVSSGKGFELAIYPRSKEEGFLLSLILTSTNLKKMCHAVCDV
jgi:hypothetical protein